MTTSWLRLQKKCHQRGSVISRARIKDCTASDVVLCSSTRTATRRSDDNDPVEADEEFREDSDRENTHVVVRPFGPGSDHIFALAQDAWIGNHSVHQLDGAVVNKH
jgi:hypothetical protein